MVVLYRGRDVVRYLQSSHSQPQNNTAIVSAESKVLISPARKLSKTTKPKVLQAARGNRTLV